jgi:hypothetical protein
MKELIAAVQRRLPPGVLFKQGDLHAVRRAYDVIGNPNWTDTAKHASTQYSHAFEDWLVDNFTMDSRFAAKARSKARREGK